MSLKNNLNKKSYCMVNISIIALSNNKILNFICHQFSNFSFSNEPANQIQTKHARKLHRVLLPAPKVILPQDWTKLP